MHHSERYEARNKRIAKFSNSVAFRPNDPANAEAVSKFKKDREARPALKKWLLETSKRATAIALAYTKNGPDLHIDKYLRKFLAEYNNRIFMTEGSNMPLNFNVMRSFTDPDEECLVLKLLPEKFYYISLNMILDHVTSPNNNCDVRKLRNEIDELTIYELNMLGGYSDLIIPGHEDFTFCGCAFVREHDELSIMAVLGKKNPNPYSEKIPIDQSITLPGKEFLNEGREHLDVSDDILFDDIAYKPIILLTRIDLKEGKIQVRYVLEEQKDTFNVSSDDPDMLEDLRPYPDAEERIGASLEQIGNFSDLFSVISLIPTFCSTAIDRFGDDWIVERHPTQLKLERAKPSIQKILERLKPTEKSFFAEVYTLYDLTSEKSKYEMPESGLVVETVGYWKTLPSGETGKDKSGRSVQGKTWVNGQSSWFQSKVEKMAPPNRAVDVTVGVSNDERVGEVYVMRSALHPKDVYKVGFTTKNASERAAQLASTSGQPDMFNVVQSWRVKNPREIEHMVHNLLSEYRINNNREFFKVKYSDIRAVIERVINNSNALLDE